MSQVVDDDMHVDNTGGDLVAAGVSKQYGGVSALSNVSIRLEPGKIHALIGENGAGKSTLGKIIAGVISPDEGSVTLGGKALSLRSPRDAIAHGIVTIAQELTVVPSLSVAANVFLGSESSLGSVIRRGEMLRRYQEVVAMAGFDLPADALVGTLSTADKQKVEVMRALSRKASVVIMDEPSAALSTNEISALHGIIRQLAQRGVAIVLISHFLSEVLELADTITTLRDGHLIATQPSSECNEQSLIEGMLGRVQTAAYPVKSLVDDSAPLLLHVEHLSAPQVNDCSLSVRSGEILGIAGLVGSGRSELVRAIFRDAPLRGGSVVLNGVPLPQRSPRRSIRAGMAFIPESRKELGLLMGRSIRENVGLSRLHALSRWTWITRRRERDAVQEQVDATTVKSASLSQVVRSLSGGNQQKLLFARTLVCGPQLLICDEPTRGVDVGSKRAIYDLLAQKAQEGMGIIVVSSELEEILGLCHRVVVMRHGRISAELQGDDVNEQAILAAAFADPAGR